MREPDATEPDATEPDATEPDALFSDPRLAELYDAIEGDRSDLDTYVAIADALGATSVLDIGSGTGTLACRLALGGTDVVGVEPAAASIEVARTKPGADRVRWIHGIAAALPDVAPELAADLATMTANVAQVFTTDEAWAANLAGIARSLRPGGHLAFETRVPARRAWVRWNPADSRSVTDVEGHGAIAAWHELVEVDLPLVTFRSTIRWQASGEELISTSTLRFRERDESDATLAAAGFRVGDVRDSPDRPGLEWVFVAQRSA